MYVPVSKFFPSGQTLLITLNLWVKETINSPTWLIFHPRGFCASIVQHKKRRDHKFKVDFIPFSSSSPRTKLAVKKEGSKKGGQFRIEAVTVSLSLSLLSWSPLCFILSQLLFVWRRALPREELRKGKKKEARMTSQIRENKPKTRSGGAEDISRWPRTTAAPSRSTSKIFWEQKGFSLLLSSSH